MNAGQENMLNKIAGCDQRSAGTPNCMQNIVCRRCADHTLRPMVMNGVKITAAIIHVALAAATVVAQDASLLKEPSGDSQGLSLRSSSFMHRELPPEARPRTLQKNDIITVIVDYRTRMLSEGDAESRKTSSLLAVLTDWIRFDGKSVKPAPQNNGDPSIGGTYNSQYRAESDVELRDSLNFRIAAKIVDIRPNGNLVLEAHWDIRNNEEQWRISLTGVTRREAIQPDRTVTTDLISELRIVKEEMGQVRDGYARGWFQKWYDRYKPF